MIRTFYRSLVFLALLSIGSGLLANESLCKYAPQVDKNIIVNKETGERLYPMLPLKSSMEKFTVDQCEATCWLESTGEGFNQQIELYSGGKSSLNRVDFVVRQVSRRMQEKWSNDYEAHPQNHIASFLHAKKQTNLLPEDLSVLKNYQRHFDLVSMGNEEEIFSNFYGELKSFEAASYSYSVFMAAHVIWVPKKSKEDYEFEEKQVHKFINQTINIGLLLGTSKAESLQKLTDGIVPKIEGHIKALLEDGNLGEDLKDLLKTNPLDTFKSFSNVNLELKLLEFEKALGDLIDDYPSQFDSNQATELVRILSNYAMDVRNLQNDYQQTYQAKFNRLKQETLNENLAYWQKKQAGYQAEVLRMLFVRFPVLSESDLQGGNEDSNHAWLRVVDSLQANSMLTLLFNFRLSSHYKPKVGKGFNVLHINEQNIELPLIDGTKVQDQNDGYHQEEIINVLVDGSTGEFKYVMLQGTYGSGKKRNGKYLVDVEYLKEHLEAVVGSELVEVQVLSSGDLIPRQGQDPDEYDNY